MAQYDLVFVQNNASSGVAFSEIKLGKPPDVGFALTQHPNTGLLSWVQSMNLITVYGQNDSVNLDTLTKTGMYHIHKNTTVTGGPSKCDGGTLMVYNSPSGIYQVMQGFEFSTIRKAVFFVRFNDSSSETWSSWSSLGGAVHTQWGDDPEFSSAVRDEIEQSTIKTLLFDRNSEMELSPEHINCLLIIAPEETPKFTVSIPSNIDLAFLEAPTFKSGSVYTIRSMSDLPIQLLFYDPTLALGEAQVVHTNGYYHPGKHKSIQLICIGNDEWLVEGAVPDPPVFEEDEDPEPIKN